MVTQHFDGLFTLFAAVVVAVIVEFDMVADELHHILGSGENFLDKLAVNFLGDIGRIPCFNVETVKEGALANPLGKGLVCQCSLLAEPCKVVTVKELAVLVQQKCLQALFDSLLTVENGRVEQASVLN